MFTRRCMLVVVVVAALAFASAGVSAGGEAPMLAEKVNSGDLPSLSERVPIEPAVVTPLEEVGQYGGSLYVVAESLRGFGTDMHVIGIEPPLRLASDGVTVVPNVLRDYHTDDYQTWTLYFREGMRWSDGAPFTADDMVFWWEDEVYNPEITESIYIREFQNATLKKIDDYTVELTLEMPFPMFEYTLTTQWGYLGQWWRPKHYLKQFHPSYTDRETLEAMVEAGGHDSIRDLYLDKAGWSAKPVTEECPALTAFVPVDQRLDVWVWDRNPYYWKVDTEGNQLPYIDQVIVREIRDTETIQGQVISGEVDIEVWHTTLENYPLYKANEDSGDYRTLMWSSDKGAEVVLLPNESYEDPVLRGIFQDVRFRQALSLAIDRDEINDMLYFGLATPRQYTLHSGSEFYKEEWSRVFAECDPDRANALLDAMGLTKRDNEGFRLMSDGRRLAFAAEYWPSEPEAKTPILELTKDYWAAIGIDLAIQPQDRSLNAQRSSADSIALNVWHGGNVIDLEWQITLSPPLPMGGQSWGNGFALWYETGGEDGVEPPESVKQLYATADELMTETDPARRLELGQTMWQMQADNLWVIGTVGMAPYPIIARSNLRNIPENGLWSALWLHRYSPEQFFLKR